MEPIYDRSKLAAGCLMSPQGLSTRMAATLRVSQAIHSTKHLNSSLNNSHSPHKSFLGTCECFLWKLDEYIDINTSCMFVSGQVYLWGGAQAQTKPFHEVSWHQYRISSLVVHERDLVLVMIRSTTTSIYSSHEQTVKYRGCCKKANQVRCLSIPRLTSQVGVTTSAFKKQLLLIQLSHEMR